jgi:uncharacterized protein (DUF1800 family)
MTAAAEICHLWRRAAFGATPEDIRRGVAQGYEASVHELVAYETMPDPDMPPPFATTLPPGVRLTLLEVARVIQWWLGRMIASRRPLQEKLTLFWHGHFTTSVDPVIFPALLLGQNQLLRAHAGGRFKDLLFAVARDPAMLVYLDGRSNTREHPNENFAREVLELYTLGEGHYTERDIREAARAFTGWTVHFPTMRFHFDAERHDDGVKRFLGRTGQLSGEDVLEILADHPQTARHICAKLFRWLVDREPTAPELAEAAAVFTRHHGTVRPVVSHLLLSPAFRAAATRRHTCKSPIEFLVSAMRALRGESVDLELLRRLHAMGQLPFLPPTVKGWPGGDAWLNTSTLLDRFQMARLLARAHPDLQTAPTARLLAALGLVDASEATRRALDGAPARRLELALASPDFQMR